jgi:hypothetical protein
MKLSELLTFAAEHIQKHGDSEVAIMYAYRSDDVYETKIYQDDILGAICCSETGFVLITDFANEEEND